MSVSLVVGLGNPGSMYEHTRHNIGWDAVNAYASRQGFAWREERSFRGAVARGQTPDGRSIVLLRPLTFMNVSGECVQSVASFFKIKIDAVVVVYDELTLSLGRMKVSVSGSSGGHNGIASILAHLGDGFTRLRLGIGPKTPKEMDLADFVLSRFTDTEHERVRALLPLSTEAIDLILRIGPTMAMNRLNQRPSVHDPE